MRRNILHLSQTNPDFLRWRVREFREEVGRLDGLIEDVEASARGVRFLNFTTFRAVSGDEVARRLKSKRGAIVREIDRITTYLDSLATAAS